MRFKMFLLLMLFAFAVSLPVVQAQDVGKAIDQTEIVSSDSQTAPVAALQATAVVVQSDVSGKFASGDTITLEQLVGQGKVLIQTTPHVSDGAEIWIGYALAALLFLFNGFKWVKRKWFVPRN